MSRPEVYTQAVPNESTSAAWFQLAQYLQATERSAVCPPPGHTALLTEPAAQQISAGAGPPIAQFQELLTSRARAPS